MLYQTTAMTGLSTRDLRTIRTSTYDSLSTQVRNHQTSLYTCVLLLCYIHTCNFYIHVLNST